MNRYKQQPKQTPKSLTRTANKMREERRKGNKRQGRVLCDGGTKKKNIPQILFTLGGPQKLAVFW